MARYAERQSKARPLRGRMRTIRAVEIGPFINLHLPGAATSQPVAELARTIRSRFLAVEGQAA